MTTPAEWEELVEWVNLRWPDRPWKAEQAVAYFYDLQKMDATDVWSALYALYEAGRAFAPTGSELLARSREEARRRARDAAMDRPELPAGEPTTWDNYSMNRFGRILRPQEVIEQLYRERTEEHDEQMER